MARATLVVALLLIGCAPVASSASPTSNPASTPSASPTTTPNASLVPTATPGASGSLRANPTVGPATYTSVALAYRIAIPAGWYRSDCVSGEFPGGDASEIFFR